MAGIQWNVICCIDANTAVFHPPGHIWRAVHTERPNVTSLLVPPSLSGSIFRSRLSSTFSNNFSVYFCHFLLSSVSSGSVWERVFLLQSLDLPAERFVQPVTLHNTPGALWSNEICGICPGPVSPDYCRAITVLICWYSDFTPQSPVTRS